MGSHLRQLPHMVKQKCKTSTASEDSICITDNTYINFINKSKQINPSVSKLFDGIANEAHVADERGDACAHAVNLVFVACKLDLEVGWST